MNLPEVLAEALSVDFDALLSLSEVVLVKPPASFDLIAVGKGAAPFVDAVLDSWGSLCAALVVLPDGSPAPRAHPRVRVLRASHPLPDARSVAAGEAALTLAAEGEGAELHVHVSGGASSLLATPVAGVTLAQLRDVTEALLRSGADVRAINVVRRHLSRAHGGGLARAAWPRRTITSIVSDVIDGAPFDVGSGPTAVDPTTVEDARRALARFAPSFRDVSLAESLKAGDGRATSTSCAIVLEPRTFAEELARALERAGCAARVLPSSTDDVARLAGDYVTLARALAPGEALVRSAEPSVRVDIPRPGSGGRCTHVAALVARDLPPGVEFMAAASDGVDGSSETGGAIVKARSFRRPHAREELDAAIRAFDTGTFHRAHRTALPGTPTGLNFADVHVLARARDETSARR
jgi:glycerate 2-kinase